MQVSAILRNKTVLFVTSSIVGAGVGFTVGYILGKRNGDVFVVPPEALKEDVENVENDLYEEADTTLYIPMEPDVVKFISTVAQVKLDELAADEENHTRMLPLTINDEPVPELSYKRGVVASKRQEPVPVNVFTVEHDDYWNMEEEMSTREKGVPYILHVDEFVDDDMGYRQETLTYYAGDDIMADAQDNPIYNYSGLMGELKFGHGCNDKNTVYIRNESIHMEWEVLLHQGSFSQEVLGLEMENDADDELQHSHSVLKFRRE